MARRSIFFLLIFYISRISFSQEYVSIQDIAISTGASISYVQHNDSLILQKNTTTLILPVSKPWYILNYKVKTPINNTVEFKDGTYFIPKSVAMSIEREFPSTKQKFPPEDEYKITTIVIDAGHGGHDPGALNQTDVKYKGKDFVEKDLVLDIAKKLFAKLKVKFKKLNIVMTRNKDEFITLEGRSEIANKYIKDIKNNRVMFVSIHANANIDYSSTGFEVWHLPKSYDRNLVESNAMSFEKEMSSILNNLYEDQYDYDSELLSNYILESMNALIGKYSPKRGVLEGDLAVTRNSKMPAVLVEVGFVSSDYEAKLLTQDWYQNKIVDGIINGIDKFIAVKSGKK